MLTQTASWTTLESMLSTERNQSQRPHEVPVSLIQNVKNQQTQRQKSD